VTEPTGRVFISYRRTRAEEIANVVLALHERGIPTWQDIHDLEELPTEDEIRSVIRDENTAGGVLWLTPEVRDSPMIRTVEIPELITRANEDSTFFIVPVLAGGLDFTDVDDLFSGIGHADGLRVWNIRKASVDGSLSPVETAQWVLERRLAVLHRTLLANEPLQIDLYTRARAPLSTGAGLTLDWFDRLDPRPADPQVWTNHLIPAMSAVSETIRTTAPGRRVVARGLASIPAATVLGSSFLTVAGPDVAWMQLTNGQLAEWGLSDDAASTDRLVKVTAGIAGKKDVAIAISITNDVTAAIAASAGLPSFRARVTVGMSASGAQLIENSIEAARLARAIIAAARRARTTYNAVGDIHVFIAGPLGLAVMLGRMLNTFGRVFTYEFLSDELGPRYVLAAVVHGTN
jgi:hypothetical protein